MTDLRVIARKRLPTHAPIGSTVLLVLALDHWQASQMVRGICWTLMGLVWIVCIWALIAQKQVDPFTDGGR